MTDYTEPRIGTVGFDGPPQRTYAKLNLMEYQESFSGTPSSKSLARLRRAAGDDFAFVLRASMALTHVGNHASGRPKLSYLPDGRLPDQPFDTGELGQAAWGWTLEAARALGAEAIFWQTPATFRPTPANRERLATFVEHHLPGNLPVIWDSQGLWEIHELAAASRDLGLIPCYDPLLEPTPLLGNTYLRVLGKARSVHGLSADELCLLADAVAASDVPRVALHTPSPFRDARSLVKVITGS
jgi:uncharacterized protein YecE (DUF72 family)